MSLIQHSPLRIFLDNKVSIQKVILNNIQKKYSIIKILSEKWIGLEIWAQFIYRKRKKDSQVVNLLGSTSVKAASKNLMKLTPGHIFTYIFYVRFFVFNTQEKYF